MPMGERIARVFGARARQEARLAKVERRIEEIQASLARIEARQPTVENLLRQLDRSRRSTARGVHPMWTEESER
jgi:hypothetical protein